MQYLDFFNTATWIVGTVPIGFVDKVLRGGADDQKSILKHTHDFVRVQNLLIDHPHAREILEAFHLHDLLDPEFCAKAYIQDKPKVAFPELAHAWDVLTNCLEPIRSITIPEVIRVLKPRDDVLTVEFRSRDETRSIDDVILVLDAVNNLYAAINRLHKVDDPEKLSMVYSCMGSGVRFDFTGVGETIKEFKSLLIDIWHTIRHREAEDLQANVKATVESLALIREIRKLKGDGTLDSEEANHLTAIISSNTNVLFTQGVSIREIVPSEFVNNVKLLDEYRQKMLPAPDETQHQERKSKARKPSAKKKKHRS